MSADDDEEASGWLSNAEVLALVGQPSLLGCWQFPRRIMWATRIRRWRWQIAARILDIGLWVAPLGHARDEARWLHRQWNRHVR